MIKRDYSTQKEQRREWRGRVENSDVNIPRKQNAFDTVKIVRCVLLMWMIRWLEYWLAYKVQTIVVNCAKFNCQLVTCCMPEGSILELILFNFFITNLNNGTEMHTQEVNEQYQIGESG